MQGRDHDAEGEEMSDMKVQNLQDFRLPEGFRGRSAVYVQLWWFVHATFFCLSPQIMYGWRNFLLRLFGAKIGCDVRIRPTVEITYPWKLSIGKGSWIGDHVRLYTLGNVEIQENVVVSQECYLCTASHNTSSATFDTFAKKICIESESWLATDVFVAPGVRIGHGAVIGARSSVFSDIPPMMICYGYPAKSVRSRN